MVSMNPNAVQAQGFYLDPSGVPLPGLTPAPPIPLPLEDPSKKVRKPYTITKSRESWTEQEHDKFLEALQLFDRDWRKIEAFVGSKTVIQIRSHAQKYFLKIQKNGSNERVPPPRSKRKATHPYPQKAAKTAPTSHSQSIGINQASDVNKPEYIYCYQSSSAVTNQPTDALMPNWNYSAVLPAGLINEADAKLAICETMPTGCSSSSSARAPTAWRATGVSDITNPVNVTKDIPDFAQVYSFLGSLFDPDARDHLQRLRMMDPINVKTVLLLMKNLSINLTSPEFEDYRNLLSSYDAESGRIRSCKRVMQTPGNSKPIITAV